VAVAALLLVNAVLAATLLRPELVPWDVATGPAPAAAAGADASTANRGADVPPPEGP
jgi:hypothetical protein